MVIDIWSSNNLLMDNGGGFANDVMRELGNQYSINIKQAAAYNPWPNGLNQRNHATIDTTMKECLKICLMLMKIQFFSMFYLLGIVAFMFLDSHLLN